LIPVHSMPEKVPSLPFMMIEEKDNEAP
jgi:hypothetical protein